MKTLGCFPIIFSIFASFVDLVCLCVSAGSGTSPECAPREIRDLPVPTALSHALLTLPLDGQTHTPLCLSITLAPRRRLVRAGSSNTLKKDARTDHFPARGGREYALYAAERPQTPQ